MKYQITWRKVCFITLTEKMSYLPILIKRTLALQFDFSSKTERAIKTAVPTGILPLETVSTAEFILIMEKRFNLIAYKVKKLLSQRDIVMEIIIL